MGIEKYRNCIIKARLPVILIGLFATQFCLTKKFSSPVLNMDWIGYFIEPYIAMEDHSLFTYLTQYRPWIGFPLFLIPVFDAFGTSAEFLRNISIFFAALCLPTVYLMLREKLSSIRALTVTLIPLTWPFWIRFSYNEMPIVLFFSLLSIFLFLRWSNTGNRYLLYAGSFISGFGFYIKANQLYSLNGVIAGFFTERNRINKLLNEKTVLYAFEFFLIGILPFLIYTGNVNFNYLNADQLQPEYDDHPKKSTTEVRIQQLENFTRPGLSFLKDWSKLDIHLYHLLFLTGFISALWRKEYFSVAAFSAVFLQFHYVPTDLNSAQFVTVIPFLLLVIAENFRILSDNKKFDYFALFTAFLLVLGTFNAMEVDEPEENVGSFTVEEFENYSAMEKYGANVVATNSYNIWLISMVDTSTKSYLIKDDTEFRYKPKLEELHKRPSELRNISKKAIYILRSDCETESCTVRASKIQENNNLKVIEAALWGSGNFRIYKETYNSSGQN